MKKQKKHLYGVILLIIVLSTCLIGCGNKKENNSEAVIKETSSKKEETVLKADGIELSGEYGSATTINISEVSEGDDYDTVNTALAETEKTAIEIFDISLLNKEEKEVQPDGSVRITMKISEEMKKAAGDTYTVYRMEEDNKLTPLKTTVKGDEIIFETDHFSIYIVVKSEEQITSQTTSQTTSVTEQPTEQTTEPTQSVTEQTTEQATTSPVEEQTTTPAKDPNKDDANAEEPTKNNPIGGYLVTDMSATMYVTEAVNVRQGPSIYHNRLGSLSKDQAVTVTGKCEDTGWYRISYNGGIGYVSPSYLTTTKPSEPVTEPPTQEETTKPVVYDPYNLTSDNRVYSVTINCEYPLYEVMTIKIDGYTYQGFYAIDDRFDINTGYTDYTILEHELPHYEQKRLAKSQIDYETYKISVGSYEVGIYKNGRITFIRWQTEEESARYDREVYGI